MAARALQRPAAAGAQEDAPVLCGQGGRQLPRRRAQVRHPGARDPGPERQAAEATRLRGRRLGARQQARRGRGEGVGGVQVVIAWDAAGRQSQNGRYGRCAQ
eukprot:7375741-Prymnesium_polylepis.1